MFQNIFLIINPCAGNSHSIDIWRRSHLPLLQKILGSFDFAFTQHPQHATELTRIALNKGFKTIIAVGGDGTVNEVVNGLFDEKTLISPQATLGIIPFGSGGDFARTLHLNRNLKNCAQSLLTAFEKKIDIGLIEFEDTLIPKRYFINIAEVGLGGLVMQKVNAKNKSLPALLRYLTGTLQGLHNYRDVVVKLTLDDQPSHFIKLTNLVVANGKFFGRGMCPAPYAEIDDALLDVGVLDDQSGWAFLRALPYLYSKTKNPPWMKSYRAKEITIEVIDPTKTLWTEADGEICGDGNVKIRILPGALNVLIPTP